MSEMGGAWTADALADLRARARAMGPDFGLQPLAIAVGRGSQDVNLALDALTGRTPDEAAEALRARGAEPRDWILIKRSRFEQAVDRLFR